MFIYPMTSSLATQQWKVSKAMRSTMKVEEEMLEDQKELMDGIKTREEKESKLRKMNTKQFQDLRQILFPNYDTETTTTLNRHPPLQLVQKECTNNEPMWVSEHSLI
jgi:hypothetical protein